MRSTIGVRIFAGIAAIDVRDLRVVRGAKVVLPGISLEVEQATVTGLLGPSGSGKSTLLRAIVGVQVVASGSIHVLGAPARAASLRSRVGYVTQAPSVYADLTVRENLRYFARVLGAPAVSVDRALEAAGLEDEGDQIVGTLSGGQLSRASLASALLGEPELLVLDEPTVGLDPLLRRDLWRTFRRLAERGVTLLVSSHVMDEAEHCDRLLLLRAGGLLADDTPDALRRRTGCADLDAAFLKLVESTG
jgi:ABC-2 type transport system ATP-binding protein